MADRFAQQSGTFSGITWNTQADGNGTPGAPEAGDTIYANGYDVNMADVNFAGTMGSPTGFYTTAYYWVSGAYRQYNGATGFDMALAPPPLPTTTTVDFNSAAKNVHNDYLAGFTLINNASIYSGSMHAQASGTHDIITWNSRADGNGLSSVDWGDPIECPGVTLYSNGYSVNMTGYAGIAATFNDNDGSFYSSNWYLQKDSEAQLWSLNWSTAASSTVGASGYPYPPTGDKSTLYLGTDRLGTVLATSAALEDYILDSSLAGKVTTDNLWAESSGLVSEVLWNTNSELTGTNLDWDHTAYLYHGPYEIDVTDTVEGPSLSSDGTGKWTSTKWYYTGQQPTASTTTPLWDAANPQNGLPLLAGQQVSEDATDVYLLQEGQALAAAEVVRFNVHGPMQLGASLTVDGNWTVDSLVVVGEEVEHSIDGTGELTITGNVTLTRKVTFNVPTVFQGDVTCDAEEWLLQAGDVDQITIEGTLTVLNNQVLYLPAQADPSDLYVLKADVVGPEHVELDEPRWVGAVGVGFVGTLEVEPAGTTPKCSAAVT